MIILDATPLDAKQILDLYSYYIENTAITFEEVVPSIEEFENRIKIISSKYPYLVLKDNDKILGFAYANTFHEREAYRFCTELSIYIDKDYHHKNYGKLLYTELEKRLKEKNITNLYACIAYCDHEDPYLNNNSVSFHEHMGYKKVADFKNCGYKFNTWYHMTYLEKIIGPHMKDQKEIV